MNAASETSWPTLRVDNWEATRDTLHMWTQIVGKVRLSQAPLINHWWEVTLYVSPRGLTTSSIPYGDRLFDIEFDFVDHVLRIRSSDGESRTLQLTAQPVATFHSGLMAALSELKIHPRIAKRPNEVDPAIPFADDQQHASYDPAAAQLFWQQLVQVHRVFGDFRARFVGKVSPVHFFWGSFDLACTRFSGRRAPKHPGGATNVADWVMVEGYSRELSSCGFWPGGGEEGAFYCYSYPEPDGFATRPVSPEAAYYNDDLGQFLLPYEVVRRAQDPDATLLEFLQTTYAAAADLANWDRSELEDDPARWQVQLSRTEGARSGS